MRRQLHSTAAIAATVLILCAASAAFLVFAALPASSLFRLPPIPSTNLSAVGNLAKATITILLIGYAAEVAGWIGTFLAGADGMHRLNSVLNGRRSR